MSSTGNIEAAARLHLANRYLWLAMALVLTLISQLTYWQMRFERFETLTLMAHITAALEVGLLASALIAALALPALEAAWRSEPRTAGRVFSPLAAILAGELVLVFAAVVLLAPILALHSYPEEIARGIRIPLMMLQRGLLLLLAAGVTYHIVLLLRLYLRWSAWICALLGLAWHIAVGYSIASLSKAHKAIERLNDVFYYNQIWPALRREQVFHNIEMPYFGMFAAVAAALWLLTLLLLLPAARQARGPGRE